MSPKTRMQGVASCGKRLIILGSIDPTLMNSVRSSGDRLQWLTMDGRHAATDYYLLTF